MRSWLSIGLLLIGIGLTHANNLVIDDMAMVSDQHITCSISWDNSWNLESSTSPANHDAVWVFVKGLKQDGVTWEHVSIDSISVISPFYISSALSLDRRGSLVKRNMTGEGDVESQLVLRLNESLSGYLSIKVIGIEMVYIPEGGFHLGDGFSTNTFISDLDSNTYFVDSENALSINPVSGLWDLDGSLTETTLPDAFPKGYSGFYAMKYEISQYQYADFLNTLNEDQIELNRLNTLAESPCFGNDHLDGERNSIVAINGVFGCDANGNELINESDDGGSVACNFLTWGQLTAYLDWSGLRPMSELEFEKASRGPEASVSGEYAWGNTSIVNTDSLGAEWTENEYVVASIPEATGIANYGYCKPSGPIRVGFAANAFTDRISSASSYYGLMEMSGNVWEQCVPILESTLGFDGMHGDGSLAQNGTTDVTTWYRGGLRGGGWNSGIVAEFRDLAISDRFFVYLNPDDFARGTVGGRGVISINQFEE